MDSKALEVCIGTLETCQRVIKDQESKIEQQAAQIADLTADRDSWRDQASQRVKDWDDMRQERDKALARIGELEADAARYRWLCSSDWYIGPAPQGDLIGVSWDDNNDAEGSLDQAIDRAAAALGGGE